MKSLSKFTLFLIVALISLKVLAGGALTALEILGKRAASRLGTSGAKHYRSFHYQQFGPVLRSIRQGPPARSKCVETERLYPNMGILGYHSAIDQFLLKNRHHLPAGKGHGYSFVNPDSPLARSMPPDLLKRNIATIKRNLALREETRRYADGVKVGGFSPVGGGKIDRITKHFDENDADRVMGMIKAAERGEKVFMPNNAFVGFYSYGRSDHASKANQTPYHKPRNHVGGEFYRNNSKFEVVYDSKASATPNGEEKDYHDFLSRPYADGNNREVGVREEVTYSYSDNGGGGAPQAVVNNKTKEGGEGIYLKVRFVYSFVKDPITNKEVKVLIYPMGAPVEEPVTVPAIYRPRDTDLMPLN